MKKLLLATALLTSMSSFAAEGDFSVGANLGMAYKQKMNVTEGLTSLEYKGKMGVAGGIGVYYDMKFVKLGVKADFLSISQKGKNATLPANILNVPAASFASISETATWKASPIAIKAAAQIQMPVAEGFDVFFSASAGVASIKPKYNSTTTLTVGVAAIPNPALPAATVITGTASSTNKSKMVFAGDVGLGFAYEVSEGVKLGLEYSFGMFSNKAEQDVIVTVDTYNPALPAAQHNIIRTLSGADLATGAAEFKFKKMNVHQVKANLMIAL